MTLRVDLEDVPFAILDAVKERILRSRRKRQQQPEPRPRPSLRPRPQLRKFGASSQRWVRPEPAAVTTEQRTISHLWAFTKIGSNSEKLISVIASGNGSQALKKEDVTGFRDDQFVDQYGIVKDSRAFDYGTVIKLWEQVDTGQFAQGASPDQRYTVDGHDSCWGLPLGDNYFVKQSWSVSNSHTHNVTVDRIYNPVLNADQQYLILPAGGDACIVIYLWRADWFYNFFDTKINPFSPSGTTSVVDVISGSSGGSRGRAAYIVSSGRCRAINIPQKAADVLNTIWPESVPHTASITVNALQWSFVNVDANSGCPNQFLGWSQSDLSYRAQYGIGNYNPSAYFGWVPWNWLDLQWSLSDETFYYSAREVPDAPDFVPAKYMGLKAENPVTPSIFASLNEASQFVEPEAIRQFPAFARWIVEDPDSTTEQQKYGQYSIPGDPDDNEGGVVIPDNSLTFSLSDNRNQDFPDPDSDEFYAMRYVAWDWDAPDYCRRMLAALGFTSADLRP